MVVTFSHLLAITADICNIEKNSMVIYSQKKTNSDELSE